MTGLRPFVGETDRVLLPAARNGESPLVLDQGHDPLDRLRAEGLADVVEGAELHRLDGGLDGAVPVIMMT